MIVTIRLNLPKSNNKIKVQYNTFEKVSYDKYFIASLYLNAPSDSIALETINDITGKGSLNEHFQKLYTEVKSLTTNEVKAILKDSLYPMKKIDEFYYTYFPMLNISIFQNNVYRGNLKDNEYFPQQLVGEGSTYINHRFEFNEPMDKQDNYEVSLSDDIIEVKIANKMYQISQLDFQRSVVVDTIDLSEYKGTILKSIQGRDWMQLTKSNYNNIVGSKDFFYDNGDHISINNDYAKKSSIAYSFGLYWVKERIYRYQDSNNKEICEKVADNLMVTGKINEFKTKSIVDLLRHITRDKQQEIINFILKRKDSKEIAMVGFILIDKGYEKGWNKETFQAFYKFRENTNQLIKLYSIDQSFEYSLADLIEIYNANKTTLTKNHLILVDEYYKDCTKIIESIRQKIGEITLSGIRENLGKMSLDEEAKRLRKFILENVAHFDKNIKDKDLNQLKQYEKKVDEHYILFKKVEKKLEFVKSENKLS